tara:strand:+ start:852 stop:2159 length:1308 start_codon:yes stop_codon:yes gene_type:complete
MTDTASLHGARPFSGHEFQIATRYLRAKRKHGGIALIAIISFLGISLGVAALIIIMSIMNGFRYELLSTLLGVQSHVYVDARSMTPEQIEDFSGQIATMDGVVSVGTRMTGQALVTANDATIGAVVIGITRDELAQLERVTRPVEGREPGLRFGTFDTFGTGRNGGDDILTGMGIVNQLNVLEGEEITLIAPSGRPGPFGTRPTRKAYRVSGVFSTGIYAFDQITIFMPLEQALLFFNEEGPQSIEVRVEDPDAMGDLVRDIRRQVGNSGYVYDWRERDSSFQTALAVERFAMRLILAVVILIAALNIITGLIMLVKNKGRDIAILRTMGATQNSILRIFLLIGLMIGAVGAIGGVVLGLVFVLNIDAIKGFIEMVSGVNVFDPEVYFLSRLPARLDWAEVAFATVFGLGAALLAAIPPAWRAARLDPVEALRYE